MKVIDADARTKVTPGFPVGGITPFYGTVVPTNWALCDGTNGTPDLTDRFILGDSTVTTGTAGGTLSATAAATHNESVAAHSNHVVTEAGTHTAHVVTQPSAHSAHAVTQPNAHGTHSSVGAHTHDSHTTAATTPAGAGGDPATPVTHASQGAHTHDAHAAHASTAVDAHSAHAGMTVDAHPAHSGSTVDAHSAHSVTTAGNHAIYKHYKLIYIKKISA